MPYCLRTNFLYQTNTNGFARYNFEQKIKGTATVREWKERRFNPTYPGYKCIVMYGDGREANGNPTLNTVRASYEEGADNGGAGAVTGGHVAGDG